MAVCAEMNEVNSNRDLNIKTDSKNENVDKCSVSPSNYCNNMMKQAKKEQRKPEVQIYRPGMGFQNKNSRADELALKNKNCTGKTGNICNSPQPSDVKLKEGSFNNESPNTSHKTDSGSKRNEGSSRSKNRSKRPDKEVYTPKPRISTQHTDKRFDELTDICNEGNHIPNNNQSNKTKLNNNRIENGVNDRNESRGKRSSAIDRSSPTEYPQKSNDSVDSGIRSEISNEQSFNGIDADSSSKGAANKNDKRRSDAKSKKKHGKEGASKRSLKRNRRNSNKNEGSASEECEKNPSRDNIEINNSKSVSVCEHARSSEREKKRERTRKASESGARDREKYHDDNYLTDQLRDMRLESGSNSSRKDSFSSSDYNGNKSRNERKSKRDKTESVLPPRFQRHKNQKNDNHNYNGINSSGILKLPTEELMNPHPEMLENNLYVPKMPSIPEPQVYIHKQLFDPNNPKKPEIVNIPAPSLSHGYSSLDSKYYVSEPSNAPLYANPPLQNIGYIPPPHAVNTQYPYVHHDMPKISTVPDNYMSVREGIAPPVPSMPDSRMNMIFTPPMYSDLQNSPHDHGKKRLKPIVEKNLQDITMLERELTSLLAKGVTDANMNTLRQSRWKLQLRYENIILADPKYCAEKNPEYNLWKSAFHQIIEALRKKLEEDPESQEKTKENLLNLITEGTVFYENLLEKQQETYGFNLTKLLEMEHINTSCIPEQIKAVLISTMKILIYLGDLARYKEQTSQTAKFGKARSWYLKAQQIAPKNGKPYNQLAVLALCARRKLDAVYYYMRSLAASNPFLSAKESLLALFEESKKKYELYEKKRAQSPASELEDADDESDKRFEVWIKPDGSRSHRPKEIDSNLDSAEIKSLSDVELNKRFVTSFLHVHGKLFTKVGMETLQETLNHMFKEFYFLLQRTPLPLPSSRLLQLLAINIYSVTNSSLKENGREHGNISLLEEQALFTSMAMMSLVMERCQMLHIAHKSSPDYGNQRINDDLAQLLPSVKIWTDWMSCQQHLWPPPPPHLLEGVIPRFNKNVWSSFADLLTILREIDISNSPIIYERKEGCEPVILEEDCTLSGFVPLLGAIHDPAYVLQANDKDKARHYLRISRIQFFGDYLCGITRPYLEFDVENKKFKSLVNFQSPDDQRDRKVMYQNSLEDSFGEEGYNEDYNGDDSQAKPESNELQVLWSKKEALSKVKEQQDQYKAQVQAVLQKDSQRPIILKIKPRYLIPDTNCFIDHLRLFRNILALEDFHLIVPLVVINELDGLARGSRINPHTSPEHANRVTILSREAIHFLEEKFANRHPRLRAITSKGSVMDTISFRSEEMEKHKGTNDDLILSCCLNYCKDRAELYMPKNPDDPINLFREVVLLTDDRNLRVKALAHHVPVRELLSFLEWANS